MDAELIERFKSRLLQMRDSLLADADLAREAARPVQLDQTSFGRLSRMDALQGQAMAQEAERRTVAQLQRIDAALKRIDAGDYGVCLVCDSEIDPRRLEANPTTTLCITCAGARERS